MVSCLCLHLTCEEHIVNPNRAPSVPCCYHIHTHYVILQHDFHEPTKETHPQKQIVTIGIDVPMTEMRIFMCLNSSGKPFICWCSIFLLIHTPTFTHGARLRGFKYWPFHSLAVQFWPGSLASLSSVSSY